MSFLPKDEKEPVLSNYMRIEDGKNTFRVLSSAIVGCEYWRTETNEEGEEVRRPVRKRKGEPVPVEELGIDRWGNPEQAKYFWAFVVYNYNAEKIQILEITQKRVRDQIKALIEDWGDPKEYDLVITKAGKDRETTYQVMPGKNKEKLPKSILDQYQSMHIDLQQLFTGGDPFKSNNDEEVTIDDLEKAGLK